MNQEQEITDKPIPAQAYSFFLETCSQMAHDIAGKMHVVQFIADELEELVLQGKMESPELVHRLQSSTEGTNAVLDSFRKMLKSSEELGSKNVYNWTSSALEVLELYNLRRRVMFTTKFLHRPDLPVLNQKVGHDLIDQLFAILLYISQLAELKNLVSVDVEVNVIHDPKKGSLLEVKEFSGIINDEHIRKFLDEGGIFRDRNQRFRKGWEHFGRLVESDCCFWKTSASGLCTIVSFGLDQLAMENNQ
jgi:hypothetical protein